MAYWTLAAHPDNERILDAVREQDEEWWRTGGRPVARGDRVAIYKYKGQDAVRGVIAFGEVLTDPEMMSLRPEQEPYRLTSTHRRQLPDVAPRVRVRYVTAPGLPLWADQGSGSVVDELPVARAQGGTAHHVTLEQWDRLLEEAWVIDWGSGQAAEEVVKEVHQLVRRSGQGFGLSAAERKLVERRGMAVTRRHFERRGWTVTDVSASAPYDLLCTRQSGDELHVEVKATTGDGATVLVTCNEVTAAVTNPHTAVLAVVSGVKLTGDRSVAGGGKLKLCHPWRPSNEALLPIAYRYSVPQQVVDLLDGRLPWGRCPGSAHQRTTKAASKLWQSVAQPGRVVIYSRASATVDRSTKRPKAPEALVSQMGTIGQWKCRYLETNEESQAPPVRSASFLVRRPCG